MQAKLSPSVRGWEAARLVAESPCTFKSFPELLQKSRGHFPGTSLAVDFFESNPEVPQTSQKLSGPPHK